MSRVSPTAIVAALLAACTTHPPPPVASPPAASPAADWRTDLDRHVLEQLTQSIDAGPLVFHLRPGDLPDETLAEDVPANVAHFEELQERLAMRYDGQVHVFLYRDDEDMRATTEGDADIAFSTGRCSIHQLHDVRGRGQVYFNGSPVFDEHDALPGQPGVVGLAVERGVVEVAEMVAFQP